MVYTRRRSEPVIVPYQSCLFAIINPSLSGKVGRLSTVEAVVEASMITKGEGHDELPSLLSDLNTKRHHQYTQACILGRELVKVPSQMVCRIFSGWTVKLKSSCGAGRPHSSEHFQGRNLYKHIRVT